MIHTYSLNRYNIAVDENSGTVHVLDNLTFEILQNEPEFPTMENITKKLGDKYSIDEISEAYEEIKLLKEQGQIYSSLESISNIAISKKY